MSSKASRAAALRAMREARSKQEQGLGVSRTDEYEVKDEGDVYEVVAEEDYQQLVESRRQREDFVVDDDGLGYYDDGEERLGDEEEDSGRGKKRAGATNNLTAAALKKARKTQALLNEKRKHSSTLEEDEGGKNASMWDFVQRGAASRTATTTSKVSAIRPSRTNTNDLESLIDGLDASATTTPRGSSAARRRTYGRSSARSSLSKGRSRTTASRPASRPASRAAVAHHPKQRRHEESDADYGGGLHDDGDDDDDAVDNGWANDTVDDEEAPEASTETPSKGRVRFSPTVQTKDIDEADKQEAEAPVPMDVADTKDDDKKEEDAETTDATTNTKSTGRKRFVKSRLGRISAPAKAALEQKKQATKEPAKATNPSALATTAPTNVDTSSASFKPDAIATDTTQPSAASIANLESVLQQNDKDEPYLDMFWVDAAERKGDILLFGKVAVDADKSSKNKTPTYVSCCAIVKGNLRNLLVLPRTKTDGSEGEYESLMDVHAEMKTILQPACIPHVAGASWAGKVVKRKYAFDDASLPRDETQYLKVVYDAKYPVPPVEVCNEGGKFVDRILGGGASTLENFIVKRKLMGPCWVRIRHPKPVGAPSSWCKLELQVDTPKNINRLDSVEQGPPRAPPPVVTMSLKLKTIVNPKTHKSEIVSASAVCHKNVLLDTASDESTRHMTQLSLIRPLGSAGTASGNALPQFPRDIDQEIKAGMPQLQKMPNERALLSRLFAQIGMWDPDVIVGHNAFGFDIEVLLSRCIEHKVSAWSKIGRRRKTQFPSKTHFSSGKDWVILEAVSGRLLCDTYISAKELLRETTYSLTNLAMTQLKSQRTDIEPVDVPQWFNESKTVVQLANHTLNDALLVQRLMFKLQILPLTKQLTCVAGNIWSHTMKGNRAERNEYLLLHEFHQLKFIPPEKRRRGAGKPEGGKAKYSGGLVLEPKKGLYDTFILLLDFNSLYPSIIQEYNLCFTTMDWSKYKGGDAIVEQGPDGVASSELPPLPDESTERGILPRVIQSLVERRRAVKKLMKNEKDNEKKEELDIRQKALKLTANSMYGCLGFSHSRFFAQPIAALVTAMGRETLQRTVDIAQQSVGLDVIYGDTDSIMINTGISDPKELSKVDQLGEKVKREVNRLYKTLELEIDGVFRSMLLLKKKKYAAVTVEGKNQAGEPIYGKETKGLDLVRRDWCVQSKDTGRFVLDQILSREDKENAINKIHEHLEDLAKKMRSGELPLEKYVITKGLSKHPNDYPDGKSQPHVQVAKTLLKNNRPVNTGDHIPYVITAPLEGADSSEKSKSAADRARHPEEIARSGGVLKPDVEWYLSQQILPPVSRLVEPIEGLSQSIVAEKLGLDSSKFHHAFTAGATIDDDQLVDYTPASCLSDEERFKDVEKLQMTCMACNVDSEFPGVFLAKQDDASGTNIVVSGLRCVNPDCPQPEFWGTASHMDVLARVSNTVSCLVHRKMKEYYHGVVQCDDPSCHLHTNPTRQLSVAGPNTCLARGCAGRMHAVYPERALHNQLKYLDTLFDVEHACEQLERRKVYGTKLELTKNIAKYDKVALEEIQQTANKYLCGSAFNWIAPSFWSSLFGATQAIKQ